MYKLTKNIFLACMTACLTLGSLSTHAIYRRKVVHFSRTSTPLYSLYKVTVPFRTIVTTPVDDAAFLVALCTFIGVAGIIAYLSPPAKRPTTWYSDYYYTQPTTVGSEIVTESRIEEDYFGNQTLVEDTYLYV